MTISITHGANGLVYSAKKAGVLWLTGNVSVCLSGGATKITLKNTKATSHVPEVQASHGAGVAFHAVGPNC